MTIVYFKVNDIIIGVKESFCKRKQNDALKPKHGETAYI